ncbi:MAG: PKD domain-containing protein, partial [Phaeodactylibacter sp.]|nr:PKD domain-containing protein [Phaeodactylibacter sp.]
MTPLKLRAAFALTLLFSLNLLYGQEMKPELDKSMGLYTLEPVTMPKKAPAGIANPIADLGEEKWKAMVINTDPILHGSEENALVDSVKEAAMLVKKKWNGTPAMQEPHQKVLLAPFVDEEFIANVYDGWRPQDNDMAISGSGHIVSVVNSNISYYTSTGGVVLQSQAFTDFYDFLGLNGGYFDPRVLFDPVAEKFILVVLNGSTPTNSAVVVSFSISDNPDDGWWTYTFEGNAPNPNTWFDFPNIGISGEDLFISSNLFTANDNYDQAVILQLDKDAGYTGDNVTWEYFGDVENGSGNSSGSVKPLSLGYDAGYGPGVYLVSSSSSFGNAVHLYDIDGDVDDNQTITAYAVSTTPYSAPANAFQLGSSKTLDTGDARVQSGFYANGIAHFVFNTDAAGGFSGIRYNRLQISGLSNQITNITQTGYDLAYGSCALFSQDVNEAAVLIGFERTSEDVYPEFAVVSVDENMSASNKVLVREGQSPIDASSGNNQRWGDYTGISRKHNDPDAAVWVVGTYGRNNAYGNWIGEVKQDNSTVAPVANFSGTPTSGNVTLQVQFTDLSVNNPTSWFWEFEGGNPATSSSQNP